jgi:RAQPRD family integrative conjugative element protein
MSTSGKPTIIQPCTLGLMLLAFLVTLKSAPAADAASEDAQLSILVRQLDMIDRLAAQSEQLPHESAARYHFDYARLHADVQRMRAGIQDYLSPQRAQPRDPDLLLGDYRAEQKTQAHP